MSDAPESKWRMTEEDNGHKWGYWKQDPFECCQLCGLIRRADKKSKPCRGKVHIELRKP